MAGQALGAAGARRGHWARGTGAGVRHGRWRAARGAQQERWHGAGQQAGACMDGRGARGRARARQAGGSGAGARRRSGRAGTGARGRRAGGKCAGCRRAGGWARAVGAAMRGLGVAWALVGHASWVSWASLGFGEPGSVLTQFLT